MKHVRQPRTAAELDQAIESTALKRIIAKAGGGQLILCGQCCVAMVADVPLQEAIIACGQVGATRTGDIVGALSIFGLEANWSIWGVGKNLPFTCIIRTVRGDSSHWVLRHHDKLYDPARHEPVEFFARDLKHPRATIEVVGRERGSG